MIRQEDIIRNQIPGKILTCVSCCYFLSSFQKNILQIDLEFIVKWTCPSCQSTNIKKLNIPIQKQLPSQPSLPRINFIDKQYFQHFKACGKKIIILDSQLMQRFFMKKDSQASNIAYRVQSCWKESNKQKQLKKLPQKMQYPVNELKKHSALLFKYNDLKGALFRRKLRNTKSFNWKIFQQRRQVSHCELILWFIDQILFNIGPQNCEVLIYCKKKPQNQKDNQNHQSLNFMSIQEFLLCLAKKTIKHFKYPFFCEAISSAVSRLSQNQICNGKNEILIFCVNQSLYQAGEKMRSEQFRKLISLSNSKLILAGYSNFSLNNSQFFKIQKFDRKNIHQVFQNLNLQLIHKFISQKRIEGRIVEFIELKKHQIWDTMYFDKIQFHHIQNKIKEQLDSSISQDHPFYKNRSNKNSFSYLESSLPTISKNWKIIPHKIYAVFRLKSTGEMIQWYFFNEVKQKQVSKNLFSKEKSDSQSDKQFIVSGTHQICALQQFTKQRSTDDDIQYI